MITARNYAAQAERGVAEMERQLLSRGFKSDANEAKFLKTVIGEAQHFALPDGGKLFDDDLRGLRGRSVRLPYAITTVEYFDPEYSVKKRMTLGIELPKETGLSIIRGFGDSWVGMADLVARKCADEDTLIFVDALGEVNGHWMAGLVSFVITGSQWEGGDGDIRWDPPSEEGKDELTIGGFCIPKFSEIWVENGITDSEDCTLFRSAMRSAVHGAGVLFELCEALSCSNVQTEPLERIDQAKNARRIRDGKLPLYETKILTIDAPVSVAKRGDGSGTHHASPRQHLRRGHIRRYDERQIWVNSCVVGSLSSGRIDKQYRVQA